MKRLGLIVGFVLFWDYDIASIPKNFLKGVIFNEHVPHIPYIQLYGKFYYFVVTVEEILSTCGVSLNVMMYIGVCIYTALCILKSAC